MKKKLLLLFISIYSFQCFSEWKFETINGVEVHFYVPQNPIVYKNNDRNNLKRSLMVNLHGCSQKAEDLKNDGNWELTADEYNMVVALPKVPNGGVVSGCWDYYGSDHTINNRHNGAILNLVKGLLQKKELNLDKDQVYLSGLSSGGGESMVMGCLAPDVFSGIGLNAGPSTGTQSTEIGRPKTSFKAMLNTCKKLAAGKEAFLETQLTSIIYGNNDFIVNTSYNINNAEIMKTLYNAHTKSAFDTKKLSGAWTEGIGTLYSDDKGPRVSLIMNTNLGHNWPSGQGGNGGNFINKKSINYPNYLAHFFSINNRRAKNIYLPEVLIEQIEDVDLSFHLKGEVTISRSRFGVKNVSVIVIDKNTNLHVDQFDMNFTSGNQLFGMSKKLPAGEYELILKITNQLGWTKTIRKSSWLGEVAGVNLPQLVNTSIQVIHDCVELKGVAINNALEKIVGVDLSIDGGLVKTLLVNNTIWADKICGLTNGKHEISLEAVNDLGLKSNKVELSIFSAINNATSTLQEHMEARRLNWEDFGFYYLKYGHQRFTLVLDSEGNWKEL